MIFIEEDDPELLLKNSHTAMSIAMKNLKMSKNL
jgi:hypothetical protein